MQPAPSPTIPHISHPCIYLQLIFNCTNHYPLGYFQNAYFTCNFDSGQCPESLVSVPVSVGGTPDFQWTRKQGIFSLKASH